MVSRRKIREVLRVLPVQAKLEEGVWKGGGVGLQGKTMQDGAKGLVAVDLRHVHCAAGALAQRVNRGSGSSPSTPTRGSARPAAGDAKSIASGASTGECSTCS